MRSVRGARLLAISEIYNEDVFGDIKGLVEEKELEQTLPPPAIISPKSPMSPRDVPRLRMRVLSG
jgi:hypothetical protein